MKPDLSSLREELCLQCVDYSREKKKSSNLGLTPVSFFEMSDMIGQLFPDVSAERITTFSCGHIVPEENLQALVVSKSPRGNDVEYKADKQGDPEAASQSRGFFFFF